jgi:hypothetical protein
MSKIFERNLLNGSVLAIAAITLIGIGLVAATGTQSVTASPAAHNLPIKVKTCKVDTSPDPVSCKPLLKSIKDMHLTFDLELQRVGGEIVITLFPTETIRVP